MREQEIFFKHSLRINDYLCRGCTTCMRSCPTGAIRIRGGKAVFNDNKCVDCGECMKVCPHKAIYIKQDDFCLIENYGYRVCLVPTTFIGQFDEKYKTKAIYSCLKKLGFTHIYEVEHEVDNMVDLYNQYMEDHPEIARSSRRTARRSRASSRCASRHSWRISSDCVLRLSWRPASSSSG